MNNLYIDFDGVILDTWPVIYEKYVNIFKTNNIEEEKLKQTMNIIGWSYIINNSDIINESINKILKLTKDFNVFVLTKVNSKEEELKKKMYLLDKGIKNVIFVSYQQKKSRVVNPKGSYLIDDDVDNLDDWQQCGGISIFFNKNLQNYDSYGHFNNNYKLINDLLNIYDIIDLGGYK